MSLLSFMVWSLILDSSLEVESLMLEMNPLEGMDIGINMENGGVMLLGIHGLDMVVEKLLARRSVGGTGTSKLNELFVLYAAVMLP
jgi:hypothetical protein